MAREHDGFDNEIGMDAPVVLRGLLQCGTIGLFYTIRYFLDVIFTPSVVQFVYGHVVSAVRLVWVVSCFTPVALLIGLHLWDLLTFGSLFRYVLWCSILRAVGTSLMDNTVVVGSLKKRHIWVPLAWWVTFTRVSSGRYPPHGAWLHGPHQCLCRIVPWIVRLCVLGATHSTFRVAPGTALRDDASDTPYSVPYHTPYHAPREGISSEPPRHPGSLPQHFDPPTCTSFTGFALPCDELQRIRMFNSDEMPRMRNVGYRGIRKAMNERGFPGHVWHVGHACPDPSKRSTSNKEDFGWNLFAQHAVDNANLGHCLVSCAEAEHVGARHVRCTRGDSCITSCTTSD